MVFVKLIVIFLVFYESRSELYKTSFSDKNINSEDEYGDINTSNAAPTEIFINVTELPTTVTESPQSECGGEIMLTYLDNSTRITSPSYSGVNPLKVECTWVIEAPPGRSIQIYIELGDWDWSNFYYKNAGNRANCRRNYVEIRDGGSESSPLKTKDSLCSFFTSLRTTLRGNVAFVKFLVYKHEVNRNFSIELSLDGYEGTIYGTHGEVSNIPSAFYTNRFWRLVGPVGHRLIIQFIELHLTRSWRSLDEGDSLITISENNSEFGNATVLAKYAGVHIPPPLVTSSNIAFIEFQGNKEADNFFLIFNASKLDCGGIYQDAERSIQTPNYGEDYPNNVECVWEIRPKAGYYIELRFNESFYIEESDNCGNDYLEIWDWRDDNWTSIARVCGQVPPNNLRSTENWLKLVFRTNDKITASGFKVKWDFLCGGTFEAQGGIPRTIVSPGYPDMYEENFNCVYNISSTSHPLNIIFDDVQIAWSLDCKRDRVTIQSSHPLVQGDKQVFCEKDRPHYRVEEGYILVIFQTYERYNQGGFKFTYYDEDCGGNITQETILQSPLFLNLTKHSLFSHSITECIWRVIAPPKQVPVLRLMDFTTYESCLNGLRILNGPNQWNDRLIKLCENIKEDLVIHAHSGVMLIEFRNFISYRIFFKAELYFSPGPAEGCGGTINLTETKHITAPDFDNLDCAWKIEADINHQIHIQITELNLQDECTDNSTSCSFVKICDGGGPVSELIEKLDGTWNASHNDRNFTTTWSMAYIRLVVAGRQRNAFKVTLSPVLSACGPTVLHVTEQEHILTSPNYPQSYPTPITCRWVIHFPKYREQHMELQFMDFNLTRVSSSTRCEGEDKLEITQHPQDETLRVGLSQDAMYHVKVSQKLIGEMYAYPNTFCGNEDKLFNYYEGWSPLRLTFKSLPSEHAKKSRGFKLQYKIAKGCNRTYTNLQGRIHEYHHHHQSDYTVKIAVPENRTITLYLEYLRIGWGNNCKRLFFEVRDSEPNGTLLVRFCDYTRPDPIFSYTNKLYIHVSAPQDYDYVEYDGWYTSTDAGRGCGGELYEKGFLSSPLYPNQFRSNTVCKWTIRVPVNLRLYFLFKKFDIQGNCDETHLNVSMSSGPHGESETQQFCIEHPPPSSLMWFNYSRIEIQYKSSMNNNGTGWRLAFMGGNYDALY